MNMTVRSGLLLFLVAFASTPARPPRPTPKIIEVSRIWSQAPHNAFPDLIRYKTRWYCAFREGQSHASPGGAIRILTSVDGERWTPAALIGAPPGDLRDPKLTVTPDNRLMLTTAEAYPVIEWVRHQTFAWFSQDGRQWGAPVKIGDPNVWLGRVAWHRGHGYSVGYSTAREKFTRLYAAKDPQKFHTHVANLFDQGDVNETSIVFLHDDTALCLLRRDGKDGQEASAMLGTARPPYRGWTWKNLGVRIGGPQMIQLPDGRLVAAGRLYGGKVRTSLAWLDPGAGTLDEFLVLPSGGDTGCPGLVYHEDLLWVSYYSSHEGKTGIYLAKVKIPPAEEKTGSRILR
jgi:hypothetical protein